MFSFSTLADLCFNALLFCLRQKVECAEGIQIFLKQFLLLFLTVLGTKVSCFIPRPFLSNNVGQFFSVLCLHTSNTCGISLKMICPKMRGVLGLPSIWWLISLFANGLLYGIFFQIFVNTNDWEKLCHNKEVVAEFKKRLDEHAGKSKSFLVP